MCRSFRSGKYYPNTQPAKKSLLKIKAEVKELTKREHTMIPMDDIISKLNKKLVGWVEYFHYGNCSSSFRGLKFYIENCVAAHLGCRHKIRSFQSSVKEYNSKRLYNEYGLYKIPETAGWKKVHASKWRTSESRVRENRMHGLMRGDWSACSLLYPFTMKT